MSLNEAETRSGAGVVLIDEVIFVSDTEDFCYRSGRFSACWHPEEGDGASEPGPQGVLLVDALRWARKRGAQIVVMMPSAIPVGVGLPSVAGPAGEPGSPGVGRFRRRSRGFTDDRGPSQSSALGITT